MRKILPIAFSCLTSLCLCSDAFAQSERTIHGQLQGADQKPSPGLTLKSQKLGTSAVTKISGEFILTVSIPSDSIIVQLPDKSTAKVGVSAGSQMVMMVIQKDGTINVLGDKTKDTATGAISANAHSADTSAQTAANHAPGLAIHNAAQPMDTAASTGGAAVPHAVPKADSTTLAGSDSIRTKVDTAVHPSGNVARAGTGTPAPGLAVAAGSKPDLAGMVGGSSDTTHPVAGKDTVPPRPVVKGPSVKVAVSGPADNSLDSVRITTSAGKSILPQSDGSFIAPFVKGSYLLVSRPGYETVRIILTSPGQLLKVKLSRSRTKEIQEVTVTALGISQKSRSVGYSIQEVRGEEVQVAKTTNFTDALQGKLAGVQINTNSGSMGGSTQVIIRGSKSITQNNSALYVVDGVFMNNENFNSYTQQIGGGGYDYGSPIQDVNPDDIQEISILKGAAASALYGSRGQNGIILVTTKKGASHKLGIEYDMNVQVDKVYVLPKFQNQYGAGSGNAFDTLWYNGNEQYFNGASSPAYTDPTRGGYDLLPDYAEDESWGPKLNGQLIRPYYSFDKDKGNPYFDKLAAWSPQPNNVRDFFETGVTVNNNLAISGGDDKATFRLSYGNMAQKFILPNSGQVRNNLSFNGTYKINDWLTGVVNTNYVNNNATGRPGTGFSGDNPMLTFVMYGQRQLNNDILKMYKYADGTQLSWNRTSYSNPAPAFDDNPYWIRYMEPESDSRNRLFGQAGFDVHPNSWLNVSARVFMDQFSILQEERSAKDYFAGSYVRTDRSFQELDYQLLATARKTLGRKFDLNASLGSNVMQQNDQYNSGNIPVSEGLIVPGVYTLANANGPVQYSGDVIRKQINSVFGTATLGYRDFLFLDVTGRNDWTSTLAPGHNSYFYPSAAVSFVFSDLLKYKWLSFGKVRTSWAEIGNDITPYSIYDTYQAPGLFGSNPTIAINPAKNNPDLRPERSTEYEEGLEARLLKSRIGLDFTWYNRMTRGLIIPVQVSPTTGYASVYANAGTVRNRGIEVELSGRPIETKNFSWDIAINFARNHNVVVALNVPNNPDQNQVVIGTERRLNSVSDVAIKGQSLFALTGTDYTYLNGKKVVDSSGNYVPSAPGQVIGNTAPDFTGGVTNTFRYKNIVLSALIDFQKGGDFFSYTNLYGDYSGMLAVTAANGVRDNGVVAQGVTANGIPNTKSISAIDYFQTDFGKRINKANVYDDSYVYLREVRLGYNLPHSWASRIRADNLRLSLYGRNLWLIHSHAPNVDPSNIINSASNIQGLEGGALPSVRSYGLNLNVGF